MQSDSGYHIRVQGLTPISNDEHNNDDVDPSNTGYDSVGWRTPSSLPLTPFADDNNGISFTPRRAFMMSFENLVAMANHQERLKEARKMVWRDKGQPVVELDTLQQCMIHAFSGAFRSSTLAFVIRACINVVLAISRIHHVPRDLRFTLIRRAIFGLDSWRFAAMLGTFTSLYKFLINALPIIVPAINPIDASVSALDDTDSLSISDPHHVVLERRKARLSLSTRAQLMMIRKQTRKWHAALAGGVAGGLAIMWEKKSRRIFIGQQMFVRGLQGSYNASTTKRNISVPHGDVIVFSLACAQILYAFTMRPGTLPRSYESWIQQAAKVPAECVRINRTLVRDRTLDVNDIDAIIQFPDITPSNKTDLLSLRAAYLDNDSPESYFPPYAPCSAVHPPLSSCLSVPLDRFFTVFKWMLPIYGALHFIPAVVFRRKAFSLDPGKVLARAGLGSLRSSAFLGVFVVIFQSLFCGKHNLHRYLTLRRKGLIPTSSILTSLLKFIPQWVIDLLAAKVSFALAGAAASGLSLFVEEKRRRGELAMYVLPKSLESAWVMARGKGWVFRTGKSGEMLLTMVGMAMVMATYQNDPQHLSGVFRRILYQFIGPN